MGELQYFLKLIIFQNQSNYSDQSQKTVNNTKDQSEFEANTRNQRQTREKACERGTIGLGFASHCLRKWREFWKHRAQQSKTKANAKLLSTVN